MMTQDNIDYIIEVLECIANNDLPSVHSNPAKILEEQSKKILAGILADKLRKGYTLENPLNWEQKLIDEII